MSNLNRQFLFRCVQRIVCARALLVDLADRLTRRNALCLPRPPLPSPKDVGKPKAEVAAARIMERVGGVTVVPHFCRIEDKPVDWYRDFHVIALGLDSLEVRARASRGSRPSTGGWCLMFHCLAGAQLHQRRRVQLPGCVHLRQCVRLQGTHIRTLLDRVWGGRLP